MKLFKTKASIRYMNSRIGKTLLAKILLWEKDVMSRPEGINPAFLPHLEMEKLRVND